MWGNLQQQWLQPCPAQVSSFLQPATLRLDVHHSRDESSDNFSACSRAARTLGHKLLPRQVQLNTWLSLADFESSARFIFQSQQCDSPISTLRLQRGSSAPPREQGLGFMLSLCSFCCHLPESKGGKPRFLPLPPTDRLTHFSTRLDS